MVVVLRSWLLLIHFGNFRGIGEKVTLFDNDNVHSTILLSPVAVNKSQELSNRIAVACLVCALHPIQQLLGAQPLRFQATQS